MSGVRGAWIKLTLWLFGGVFRSLIIITLTLVSIPLMLFSFGISAIFTIFYIWLWPALLINFHWFIRSILTVIWIFLPPFLISYAKNSWKDAKRGQKAANIRAAEEHLDAMGKELKNE